MGAEPENIRRFNDLAARILAHLYDRFPEPVVLSPEPFVGNAFTDNDALSEDARFFVNTVRRLTDFGLIQGEPIDFGLMDARLTSEGLRTLDAVPTSLAGQETLGQRLITAAREASADARSSLIKACISELSRFVTGG